MAGRPGSRRHLHRHQQPHLGAVAQNPISFAGSSSRPPANALSITPTLTYNLPHGWFAGYGDFDWTFDWEHGGAATIPVSLQAGKIFRIGKVPVSLSLEGAWFPCAPTAPPSGWYASNSPSSTRLSGAPLKTAEADSKHEARGDADSRRFSAGLLLAACVRAAASGDPAPPPATAEPSSATPPILSGPQRLKQDVRIILDTNAPPASTSTNQAHKALRLEASWRGWDGLQLELDQRTPLRNPTNLFSGFLATSNAPAFIQLDQVQMTARLGARLEVDGAGFVTTGNLAGFDDNVQLRRLLVSAQGDCILLLPVSYLVELGYVPNKFYVNQAYLLSPDMNYVGNLQFGVFGPPMGLDLVTSSRDITFMEPAAPLQAIAPPNMVGFQIGHPVFSERATWALGVFGDATPGTEYGNASKNYGSAIGRLTWLALDHLEPDHPAANSLLHLGVSADYQYSATSNVRYQSRPESYLAPIVIDTGNIDASGAATVGGKPRG